MALPPEAAAIRVVVVDDHPLFRAGLRAGLEPAPDVTVAGEAGTAAEALRVIAATGPDVVLLDLNLPGDPGLPLVRRIGGDGTAVLILTMSEDDADILAAVREGARGYLLKSVGRDALLQAIRTAAHGGSVFSAEVTARLARIATPPYDPGFPFATLSARERQVLDLVARGHGNRQIAATLFVSEKTVRNHVYNIMTKLDAPSRARLIVRAREAGLGTPATG